MLLQRIPCSVPFDPTANFVSRVMPHISVITVTTITTFTTVTTAITVSSVTTITLHFLEAQSLKFLGFAPRVFVILPPRPELPKTGI